MKDLLIFIAAHYWFWILLGAFFIFCFVSLFLVSCWEKHPIRQYQPGAPEDVSPPSGYFQAMNESATRHNLQHCGNYVQTRSSSLYQCSLSLWLKADQGTLIIVGGGKLAKIDYKRTLFISVTEDGKEIVTMDDFGVAVSPTTGLAAIIYTSDQYVNTAAEPANSHGSAPCTSTVSNSVDCSHSDIAVQTGGSGVTQGHRHHFEVEDEDFEETDLTNDGNHSPDFNMQLANTGGLAITSLSAEISGLPLAFTWKSPFPLQPGQTITGATASVPVGLVLAVGDICPVRITATLSDGTTETQTTYAIYTLGAGLGL